MKKVAIVGGGISGLLTAFFLQKKGYKVTVFEQNKDFGGKLQTSSSPYGFMEAAANGILADELVEDVLTEIGVEILSTRRSARYRYIYKKGKPRKWPLGLRSTLSLLQFLITKPWKKEKYWQGLSLEKWLNQHITKEATDFLISPACQGIFGKTSKELSASLIMNYFFNKKKVSLGKMRGTISARTGMSEIIHKIHQFLISKSIKFEKAKIDSLESLLLEFNEVIVATDMYQAGHLLESVRDLRGKLLKQIPMVDLVSINVFVGEEKSIYPGFGILFPKDQEIEALGVLQNSYIFENRSKNALSETWIYSLDTNLADDDLLKTLVKDRETVFKNKAQILFSKINRWPKALPLYSVELENYVNNTPPGHPRVHLIGNYLGEIGLNRIFHLAKALSESL